MSGYVTEANSRGWSSTGSSSTEWNFAGSTKRLLPLHFQKINSLMYLLPIYFYNPIVLRQAQACQTGGPRSSNVWPITIRKF